MSLCCVSLSLFLSQCLFPSLFLSLSLPSLSFHSLSPSIFLFVTHCLFLLSFCLPFLCPLSFLSVSLLLSPSVFLLLCPPSSLSLPLPLSTISKGCQIFQAVRMKQARGVPGRKKYEVAASEHNRGGQRKGKAASAPVNDFCCSSWPEGPCSFFHSASAAMWRRRLTNATRAYCNLTTSVLIYVQKNKR